MQGYWFAIFPHFHIESSSALDCTGRALTTDVWRADRVFTAFHFNSPQFFLCNTYIAKLVGHCNDNYHNKNI